MVFEALLLGLTTYLSLLVTFLKFPSRVQRLFRRHKLLTDLAAGAIVYLLLGAISKSIVAVGGAIITGLLVGLTLEITDGNTTLLRARHRR